MVSVYQAVHVRCLFSWFALENLADRSWAAEERSSRSMPAAGFTSFLFLLRQKKQAWRWQRQKTKNGQIVVQSSFSWKWFCAQYLDYINEVRMKSDSGLNLEKKHVSSLWIYTDFISKQKTLELSQSGIGFVMGWNLAKS